MLQALKRAKACTKSSEPTKRPYLPAVCEEISPGSDFDDDLVVNLRDVQIPVGALDVDLAVRPNPVVFSALDQVRDLLLEAPVVEVVVELRGNGGKLTLGTESIRRWFL